MFSIVVPLWNKRHTVAATLASALAQTWSDFELIIVDDGSTDGGMEETARFDDPRIRRLSQANQGPGAARNAAIRAARHDWFAFLDADDLWLPDHLEELDRIRRRFPDTGLIGTKILRSDRHGRYRLPALREDRIERVDFFESAVQGTWTATTSSFGHPAADLGGARRLRRRALRPGHRILGPDRARSAGRRLAARHRRLCRGNGRDLRHGAKPLPDPRAEALGRHLPGHGRAPRPPRRAHEPGARQVDRPLYRPPIPLFDAARGAARRPQDLAVAAAPLFAAAAAERPAAPHSGQGPGAGRARRLRGRPEAEGAASRASAEAAARGQAI